MVNLREKWNPGVCIALGCVLGAALATTVIAAFVAPPWAHDSAIAAWVQAVGTILALAVAIFVPAWQRYRAREDAEEERLLKARSLLMIIYPSILAVQTRIEQIEAIVARPPSSGAYSTAWSLSERFGFEVPSTLEDRVDEFYLFGLQAGSRLQTLMALLRALEGLRPRAQSMLHLNPERPVEDIQELARSHTSPPLRVIKLVLTGLDQFDPRHASSEG